MEESAESAGSINRVVISQPADHDVIDIWLHIVRQDLPPGVRSFPVGNYLIIYKHESGTVRIIRVLHGARQIEKLV